MFLLNPVNLAGFNFFIRKKGIKYASIIIHQTLKKYYYEKCIMVSCSNLHSGMAIGNSKYHPGHQYQLSYSCSIGNSGNCCFIQYYFRKKTARLNQFQTYNIQS